jgi:5-methylcytosine-specific restriction endonuclease McrA
MRSDSTHRRRAKKFGCSYEPVSKRKVFERDGWKCQICGISTPEAKRGTIDDDAPELDHIIPLAKRGDHSYRNTQCACRRCNLLKSDTSPEEAAVLLVGAGSARRIVDASKTQVDLPQGGVRHPD